MKRALDIAVSTLALVVLSPLIGLVALLVRINLGAPVMFWQERPGLDGRPFEIVKFRTMLSLIDAEGKQLPDEDRMTRFGKLLRSTSIDELPQLWNVLRGDMSLVGPRPLLMEYLPFYSTMQARRHEVRPGLTGWAQVNGRNALSWQDKFEYDVWYVENRSLRLDLKILWLTAVKVLRRSGVAKEGHVTTDYFKGNDFHD